MKEENKEIKYGYVVDFHEYSKDRIKDIIPLASELENIYSSKEECLEQAKEEISQLDYYSFYYGYIYIFQIHKGNINIDYYVMDNIIEMIQDKNEKNVFNYGEMYSHKKEIKQMLENYFNEKNDWDYIEIIFDDIEVYKVHIERQIKNISVDKINLT